jgi:hypothetical protein
MDEELPTLPNVHILRQGGQIMSRWKLMGWGIYDEQERKVATISDWDEQPLTKDEANANAALIARAPDLLAENERLRVELANAVEAAKTAFQRKVDATATVNDLADALEASRLVITQLDNDLTKIGKGRGLSTVPGYEGHYFMDSIRAALKRAGR